MTLLEELRQVPVFAEISDEGLEWFLSHATLVELAAGELLGREGDEAKDMVVILSGAVRGQHEGGTDDGRSYRAIAGEVTGMLPYSRLRRFPLTSRATEPSRILRFPAALFDEMLRRIPSLGPALIAVMSDRIRMTTKADTQRDKLMALGKLSAGLAHELNNPAAAAKRATEMLRASVSSVRSAALQLDMRELTREQRVYLAHLDCRLNSQQPEVLDSLEQSDREEIVAGFLQKQGLPSAWDYASSLVAAGCDLATVKEIAAQFDRETLPDVLTRVTASFNIARLVSEIESATGRISELVRAVKEYSYMDQMPEQEIDIHSGIENTLIVLRHRFKEGATIVREYDRKLPKICAFGSELNQVWTNLIDNALDAMNGKGELRLRTARDGAMLLVEVCDDGPGIPDEVRDHIFEPFYTTKPVGQGTGLGLDTVMQIVRKHRGVITVDSKPGDTKFQVRLPFAKEPKGEALQAS